MECDLKHTFGILVYSKQYTFQFYYSEILDAFILGNKVVLQSMLNEDKKSNITEKILFGTTTRRKFS
jgi:hypothetical protein